MSNIGLLILVSMLFDDSAGLRECFADTDALVPRVIMFHISSTSTVFEPRTAATATTSFAGFLDGAAFEANGTGCRRRDYWRL